MRSGLNLKRRENEDSNCISLIIFNYFGVTPKEKYAQKITEDQRYELMVELYAGELSMEQIMEEFGISRSFLYAFNAGKKHPIEGYKYPIREMGQLSEATKRAVDRTIELNMEPPESYTVHMYEKTGKLRLNDT